jgi:hypothetical protein
MAADSISNRHGKKNKQPETARRPGDLNPTGSPLGPEDPREGGIAEASDDFSEYVSESAGEIRHCAQQAVSGREGTAVFVSLAVGFGIGVLIGTTLAAPRRRPAAWRDRFMAEGLGQRVLDRIEDMLPQRLTSCLNR